MKKNKLKLNELKVKSFMTNLEVQRMRTVKGGDETTPDPTPITTTDEPIDVPPSLDCHSIWQWCKPTYMCSIPCSIVQAC